VKRDLARQMADNMAKMAQVPARHRNEWALKIQC